MRSRRIITAALLGALSLGGAVSMAAPASANVCLFQDSSYGGGVACRPTWEPDYSQFSMEVYDGAGNYVRSVRANDNASSISNQTEYRICVYENSNFWGATGYVNPWTNYPNLWMNDMISSHRIC